MMMMQYRTRKKKVSIKSIAAVLGVLVLVYLVGFTSFLSSLTGGLHAVAAPLWKAGDGARETSSVVTAIFGSKAELELENQKLKEQIERMSIDIADHDLLATENRELKEMLGRTDIAPRTVVTVLARPHKTPYDTLIIDAGDNLRITPGDLAMVGPIVVGEVAAVYADTAKVLMYSTPDHEQDGLLGEEQTPVTVVGRGSGNYYIKVPRDIEVGIGDAVLFPYIDPTMFGSVDHIHQLPNDPFKQLLFTSPVNLYSVNTLEIVPYSTVVIEETYE